MERSIQDDLEHDSWEDPWTEAPNETLEAEQFELRDQEPWTARSVSKKPVYVEGDTIDWLHEEGAERARQQHLRSQRGLRALFAPLLSTSRSWFISVATGISVGVIGAWLDVLVRWLSDLREGRCAYGFFYNQVACCSGLDPGEVCMEWLSWSQWFRVHSIFGSSLLQAFIYNSLAITFSGSAALLVLTYAPYAFHTGIPEIKAILSGYVFDEFLGAWTLLIKSLGLALAVASGLSLGKEGPLVHVACCTSYVISSLFKRSLPTEAMKRRILASAAAAGISVAFGSPLGGVLFALEELETFANDADVIWRGFVTSVIAAVSLQYINPFGTSKIVLFEVTSVSDTWRAFELFPWLFLSVLGGVLGALLIRLNVAAALYRQRSILRDYPILEVIGATALTGCISYLIVFLRVQSSELVANLFQECDPTKGDYHGLCNPNALGENIFLLILTAIVKIGLTAWTFGMMIPAGIFLPTIAIGACLGRAVGLILQGLHRSHPGLWFFSACPPDPSIRCVSPGFYAVIGASAMLGGVTRMTISLVVIMFELTGALSHVLPIMISVVVSKWVADAFGREGIYPAWIALRNYPWLPHNDFRDKGETAESIMVPLERLVAIEGNRVSLTQLAHFTKDYSYRGFPVIDEDSQFLGYVTRSQLISVVETFRPNETQSADDILFTFRKQLSGGNLTSLQELLDESPITLKKEVPQEFVVSLIQKMNLRHVFFTRYGQLKGMVTKSDVVSLMRAHVPYAGAMAHEHRLNSMNPLDVVWQRNT